MLSGLKSKRVILAGDFNFTETLSSFDTGGLLPPSHAKKSNAQAIQTLEIQGPLETGGQQLTGNRKDLTY
jgi:hypothetical protein